MLQSEVEKQINSPQGVGKWFYLKFIFRVSFINEFFSTASSPNMSIEDKMEVDGRSVFVGNVSIGQSHQSIKVREN